MSHPLLCKPPVTINCSSANQSESRAGIHAKPRAMEDSALALPCSPWSASAAIHRQREEQGAHQTSDVAVSLLQGRIDSAWTLKMEKQLMAVPRGLVRLPKLLNTINKGKHCWAERVLRHLRVLTCCPAQTSPRVTKSAVGFTCFSLYSERTKLTT